MQTRSSKRAALAAADVQAPKRTSSGATSYASSDDEPWLRDVRIDPRDIFHGQIRLSAGVRPPAAGQPAASRSWGSCLLTTQAQFGRFLEAVNCTTYSMSGKGGAPILAPIKQARPKWGRQAVLVVVCRAPFATHQLSIEQRGAGAYWALACLKETRHLAAPSGLGSFDACIFDLTDGDPATSITMMLQGKGDYHIHTPCEPLPSGPQWHK